MQFARPDSFIHPLAFGRRGVRRAQAAAKPLLGADDLKLFATTFAGGFLFVTVLLA